MARPSGRGLFVTGTDTGAGKTITAACMIATMAAAGEAVSVHKPLLTGLDEPAGSWPADHELLAQVSGMDPMEVAPRRFGPAVSPMLAAQLAGIELNPARVLEDARSAQESAWRQGKVVVFEGVGGLLAPLADRLSVRDLALALAMPLLIVARPGLGTINHTLLTLEAARTVGLSVAAVVLSPWQIEGSQPDEGARVLERSNREAIASIGGVAVEQMPRLSGPGDDLAAAGAQLPWRRWLGL